MSGIKRREFIKKAGALGAGLVSWSASRAAARPADGANRPNILVFLTDDQGQWAQHVYGNSEVLTPNMDRLAETGTRMTQAFTPCPVCSPARASFFTGCMPSQHGIHDWLEEKKCAVEHPWLEGQTLISELLKDAGYHTGLVGKWHCGRTREPHQGFDRWFSYWVAQYPHYGVQQFSDQGNLVLDQGQQSPLLTRQAIDFLRDHKKNEGAQGKPFFLFVGYVDTHSPHDAAPSDLVAKYNSATFRDILSEEFPACHGEPLIPVNSNPQIERMKHMEYYGAVSSIDREVGKILSELEATEQLENTLVVYTSDHGLNTGQHGMWEKGNATLPQNFFDESIRISCTLSWPAGGVRQNAVCSDFVNHCDLWATLLHVAGASPDEHTAAQINSPGRSYLAQLRGQNIDDWRKTIISEYGNARMARTERYKLVRRYAYKGVHFRDELYDLKEDPRETVNRFQDPALKNVIDELTAELDQFFEKYTAPGYSGLDLAHQWECTPASPWLAAERLYKQNRMPAACVPLLVKS
jgi:choline-sulfatase